MEPNSPLTRLLDRATKALDHATEANMTYNLMAATFAGIMLLGSSALALGSLSNAHTEFGAATVAAVPADVMARSF